MIKSGWLSVRAILALALTVGYIALVLGLAGALFAVPLWALGRWPGLALKLAVPFMGAGFALLFSAVPRRQAFQAPGILLAPSQHRPLFQLLGTLCREMGQRMPDEVYLVPDVNAAVTEVGGFLGMGGRRVLLVGLPLLQGLGTRQFRAVLAHEMGHYAGGDVVLGRWVFFTRESIGRTIEALDEDQWLLKAPFYLFGRLFLLVTQAISRQEEYNADAKSARVAGARSTAEALQALQETGVAFHEFMASEMIPAVRAGFRPPLGDGFSRFLLAPEMKKAVRRAAASMTAHERTGRYDSHPSIRERIAALRDHPPGDPGGGESPAVSLLSLSTELDKELTAFMFPSSPRRVLKIAGWAEVTKLLYVPRWEALVRTCSKALHGLTPASLGELCARRESVAARFAPCLEGPATPEESFELASDAVGAAFCLLLQRRGWRVSAEPGRPITVEREGASIEPFSLVEKLCSGAIPIERWSEGCRQLGIADINLGEKHFAADGAREY